MTRQQRETIASQRLLGILRTHVVANLRTLEQKISDAGPSHVRVDPHITNAHEHYQDRPAPGESARATPQSDIRWLGYSFPWLRGNKYHPMPEQSFEYNGGAPFS
jgi:hypothetical protein